jgi:hypothetical protein
MGQIYEGASLTIAASGARDPSEGCFAPVPSNSVEVPYYKPSEIEAGSMFVAVTADEEKRAFSPTRCLLAKRA